MHRVTDLLAVAEHIGVLSEFLKWFTSSKSAPSFSSIALVTDKQNFGRKGRKRKRSNIVKPVVVDITNTSPEKDILPLPNNFSAIKRTKAKNKVSEKMLSSLGSHNESLQSPQHLFNEFNSFSVQHGNALRWSYGHSLVQILKILKKNIFCLKASVVCPQPPHNLFKHVSC